AGGEDVALLAAPLRGASAAAGAFVQGNEVMLGVDGLAVRALVGDPGFWKFAHARPLFSLSSRASAAATIDAWGHASQSALRVGGCIIVDGSSSHRAPLSIITTH